MAKDRKTEIKDILEGFGMKNFNISMKNNGHYRIESDELHHPLTTSNSPSDWRANLNFKRDVRQGLKTRISRALSLEARFNDEDKKGILSELSKEMTMKMINEKYRLSAGTLVEWANNLNVDISRFYKPNYDPRLKNDFCRRYLSGEKLDSLCLEFGFRKTVVKNWISIYRKKGEFKVSAKNEVKKLALKNLEDHRDISYISSGKKEPENHDQDFDNAILLLSDMPKEIRSLKELLAEKDQTISDLKAKLEIVKEAIRL